MSKYTNKQKEKLVSIIEGLDPKMHHLKIYSIISKNQPNIKYTECQNGICIDFSIITDKTYEELRDYVENKNS